MQPESAQDKNELNTPDSGVTDLAGLLIAVCTYNEMANLPTLYTELRQRFPESTILIVDDNSPDGTGDWCDQRASTDSRFKVIHRAGKLGLGSATIEAFLYALGNGFEYVLTMDGDWSHQPQDAIAVVEALRQDPDCDLVIGSRYVAGGKITGWPRTRHWMSRSINWLTRLMVGTSVRDCSGAFRCYRIGLLQRIDFTRIQGKGYAYLEEILWWAKCLKASIREVPITFANREQGKSKINHWEALRAVWILLKIGCRRMFRYRLPGR